VPRLRRFFEARKERVVDEFYDALTILFRKIAGAK